MIDYILPAAAVAALLFLIGRYLWANRTRTPQNPRKAASWEIGPWFNGKTRSIGLPRHPAPYSGALFAIDIPQPNQQAGHLHYVTHIGGPIRGKALHLRFRLEMAEATRIECVNYPALLGHITLYFQRKGDDWSAGQRTQFYRWWSVDGRAKLNRAGEYELIAPLGGNWISVHGKPASDNPEEFKAALANAESVGFVCGGGDGWGHGFYATGPARLVVTDFRAE